MNGNKRLGKWLLYGLCLAPAVIMLGYYWLEYVPSQREYFMNLRFRSLAIMGDQLRIKIERLGTSFNYATNAQATPSEYISALVPDLTYPARGCNGSDLPPAEPAKIAPGMVEFANPANSKPADTGKGCPAEASLTQIFTGFTRDDLFEDVLIAEIQGGRVIYQRSDSSPRIATLNELLKTASGTRAAPGEGNGADADAVRTVLLDGSQYALLIQPVRIAALGGQNLQICGLVSARRLAEEARHVPPEYLLALFAPLVIVSLSSPFLKILLLTRTGRLAFRDMALLSLFTVIAAALVTLLLVSGRQYALSEQHSEQQLEDFARKLNQQMLKDMNRMAEVLERFDAAAPPMLDQTPNRADILATDTSGLTQDMDPFDFVFWANADGCQIAKWTTSRFNFPQVPQVAQENFQNVVGEELWRLPSGKRFTLQTVVSQTTSRLIVIMAMPSSHAGQMAPGCGNPQPTKIVSVALVAQLRSLSWLVPPGAGFAVFKPDGLVLFHSQADRNLHENLFEEIRSPQPWREAVATRTVRKATAYYRGRKFQFHVQPIDSIDGIPWSIAVFQQIEPRQTMIGLVWGETLILFLGLLGLLGLVCLGVTATLRMKGYSWRQQIDMYLDCLWPGPARNPVYIRLAKQLAAATLIILAVVAAGAAYAYSSTVWLLPFCLAAPVATMIFAGWQLWKKAPPGSADLASVGDKEIAYFVCLSLGLAILAVIPTLGLWSICEAYETRAYLRPWQHDLVKAMDARRSRMRADVQGSRALSETARTAFRSQIEAASAGDEQHYVATFWKTKIKMTEKRNSVIPCHDSERGDNMKLRCASSSGTVEVESTLPPIGIPLNPVWGLAGLALLGCAYTWNCKAFGQLFLLDFRYAPLPLLTPDWSPSTPPHHLLVLGLPLAKKDRAVRQWLGYTPLRVSLYTAHFSKWWVTETIALLQGQLTAEQAPAAQAAAVGATAQPAPPVEVQKYVHISNLEAKLSEPGDRQVTADLIEQLVTMRIGEDPVRLIVTSVVDPMRHFDSVLNDERKKIYEHPLPEPELQRLAHLLHNFRKVQAPGPDVQRPVWAKGTAGEIVYDECRHHQELLDIGEEVAGSMPADLPPRPQLDIVLWKMISERARALYKLYWSSCTRAEKLLLIQLAQTGFVNPLCVDTLEELIRKGLILQGRRPRLMNETFRQFLETVEDANTVHEWESEGGESSWLIVRNIVLVLIIVGLAVVGLAEYQIMQTAAAALTGVVTLLAGLSRLLGFLTGNRSAAAAESA
jgi:hypothetical protein